MKQYANRNPIDLDKAGGYYCRHIAAMTEEDLYSKADIAAELAYRDMRIAELEAQVFSVSRFEMIDHLSDEGGRFFSTGVRKPFRVELGFQDRDRTLKVFLTPK
jgi:hypothetical protein